MRINHKRPATRLCGSGCIMQNKHVGPGANIIDTTELPPDVCCVVLGGKKYIRFPPAGDA